MQTSKKMVIFEWGGLLEVVDGTDFNYKHLWSGAFEVATGIVNPDTWGTHLRDFYDKAILGYNCPAGEEILVSNLLAEYADKGGIVKEHAVNEFLNYFEMYEKCTGSYRPMTWYSYSLKGQCRLGVMADITCLDRARITLRLGIDHYDAVYCSYEHGVSIQDGGLFDVVEKDSGLTKGNILLLSNSVPALEHARQHGWNTYRCNGAEVSEATAAITAFLLN